LKGHSNSDNAKLVIGHNVAFDRSYVMEQYNVKVCNTVVLDYLCCSFLCW